MTDIQEPGPQSSASNEGMRFALRALDNRNYRIFFWPQALSLCGTWMQHTAQGWLVYRLSNSPGWLGSITFLTLFPIFIFSLWAGVMGDRHPRRWILWTANAIAAVQAIVLGVLTLTGTISVQQIAAFALILGIVNAFEIPNRQAFVLDLVSRSKLPSAVALNSTAFNLARLAGPLLAGVLIPWKGEGICFLVNGLTYLPVLVALPLLRLAPKDEVRDGQNMWQSLKSGLAYVFSSTDMRSILLLLASTSLCGVWFPSYLPVFARDLHGGGPIILGMMLASVAAGSLLGAYALAKRSNIHGLGGRTALGALAFSVGLVLFANTPLLSAALIVLLSLGFCMVTLNVGTNTIVQTLAPDELRGRISSVYTVSLLGIGPLGALSAGFAAEMIGVPAVTSVGGIGCFLATCLMGLKVAGVSHLGQQKSSAEGRSR